MKTRFVICVGGAGRTSNRFFDEILLKISRSGGDKRWSLNMKLLALIKYRICVGLNLNLLIFYFSCSR